jgi:hypothetical protein
MYLYCFCTQFQGSPVNVEVKESVEVQLYSPTRLHGLVLEHKLNLPLLHSVMFICFVNDRMFSQLFVSTTDLQAI